GVIFDFNGTLFWDSEYQETSWDNYLETHHINLTMAQKKQYIHGRNGKDTFEILFKRKLSDSEVQRYTEEKEIIYREECLKHKMELAPGAKRLLEYLKTQKIPMAIATASGKTNVDFFIDKFNLLDYFAEEHIIYNDGTIKGKPHPDLFEKAIARLGVKKSASIIFEDSISGIQAAINCKVASVIIVNSVKGDYAEFELPVIEHFDEFDRNLLRSSCVHWQDEIQSITF
ncbi:MAG TPA: HAD family phosphatase, partial [Prolixibacteraceae bacterium]